MTASSTPLMRQRGGILFLAKSGIFAAFPDGMPRQKADVVWGVLSDLTSPWLDEVNCVDSHLRKEDEE
jgi:hypothetical protein